MATIIKSSVVDADPADAWAALRDFAAVHERLAPGFVTDCRMADSTTRVVTFFNGAVAREVLVGIDDDARRLAYSVVDGPLRSTHHNASAQVLTTGDGRTRFVWTTDVLPDAVAPVTDGLMTRGLGVVKATLEGAAVTPTPSS